MSHLFFASKSNVSFVKKAFAGLMMLSLNLSIGGVGTVFLTSQVAHAVTPVTVLWSSSFESNTLGDWDSHDTDWHEDATLALTGSKSLRIKADTSGTEDVYITKAVSTSGYQDIKVSFSYFITESLETSDYIKLQVSTDSGVSWSTVYGSTVSGVGTSTVWQTASLLSATSSAPNNANVQVRFAAHLKKSGSNKDEIYIDDFSIVGTPIVVDTLPPTVSITTPAASAITGPSGSVVYSTGDATTVSCTLDSAPVACTLAGPYAFGPFSTGSYTFAVTATDEAGNSASESRTWTVDATGPVVTITAGPTEGSTITTDSATFGFSVDEAVSQLQCLFDLTSEVCTSPKTVSSMTDGAHSFGVRGTDMFGNIGAYVTRLFSVDTDADNDGVKDAVDNCPNTANANQADMDDDGLGDACDSDVDGDEVADTIDNCPLISNIDQVDVDQDLIGDACDTLIDSDEDTISDSVDNCPLNLNTLQEDRDDDQIGDVCDTDNDNDGVLDTVDNCPIIANADQADIDHDDQGNACDSTDNRPALHVVKYVDGRPIEEGQHVSSFFDVFLDLQSDESGPTESRLDSKNGFRISSFFDVFTEVSVTEETVGGENDSTTLSAGAACVPGQLRLVGYTSGATLEDAADKTPSTENSLVTMGDRDTNAYTIVWNETCPNAEVPPTPPSGGGGSSTFDYYGCTDATATNFNSLANKDDGSCKHKNDTPNGGGGSEATTTTTGGSTGEVLGAATTTPELPLPPACVQNPYLRDYLKMGKKNDPEQVKLLQTLLNEQMGANLPVTGFFGNLTKTWVKKFQKAHRDEIIKPWIDAGYKGSIIDGTGYVYKTTKRAINIMKCEEADIPMPDLTPDLGK